jgi:hypothetical protein
MIVPIPTSAAARYVRKADNPKDNRIDRKLFQNPVWRGRAISYRLTDGRMSPRAYHRKLHVY